MYVYSIKYAHGFSVLCFILVILSAVKGFMWPINIYPSELLHRHCVNDTITPMHKNNHEENTFKPLI